MPPKYVKLTTKDNIHNNFTYKEGLNTDHLPLNDKECEAGGLYFTDMDNWLDWVNYNNNEMYWIWDCEPVGEIISFDNKYKAQSIILSNPRCIWNDVNFQSDAIKKYNYGFKHIDNPSEELKILAVGQNGSVIQFIKNPSEAVQLAAVKQNGNAIKYIKNPSEAVQLEAVKENGNVIEFIKNPPEDVQLYAVNKDGFNIYYIKKPSEAVQLAAVKQNGGAIEMIADLLPSEAVQLAAVRQNGRAAIHWIKNPSEVVQLAAVMQNREAFFFIEEPYDSVKKYFLEKS
jgi:hypothetical protein